MRWQLEDHEREALAAVSQDTFKRDVIAHAKRKAVFEPALSDADYEKIAGFMYARVDAYLDSPATESETDAIQAQAGDRSKADRRALQDCANCIWCQINIQAQGSFLPLSNRSDPQGIGPYLVKDRTVFVREGIIIAGLTHTFAQGLASRRNFRQIESWGILAKTIAYIQARPPMGLPPGEHRNNGLRRYSSEIRYDIEVQGTVNAFMS